MKVDLLGPQDERWATHLEGARHEFYHQPGYVALEAARMGGEPVAVLVRGDSDFMLLPLVLRDVDVDPAGRDPRNGARDGTSPYGYPGPVFGGESHRRAEFFSHAVRAAAPELAGAGVISAFVRLNPLLNRTEELVGAGHLVEHGTTVWIDLTLPPEELHRQVRPRFRSNINATVRGGVTARFDCGDASLKTFVDLYHRTMDRVGAESWYFFDHEYFRSLTAALGDQVKLCLVEDDQGIAAAGMFGVSDGVVQYLFSGTTDDQRQPHATKLMMVYVRDWAQRNGYRQMHLGGGLGSRDDSLGWFKRGFSKLTAPFHTWRVVFDRERFDHAVAVWEQKTGKRADDISGFFPPYRQSIDQDPYVGSPSAAD